MNCKLLIIISLLLLFSEKIFAQEFEGIIEYESIFKPKDDRFSVKFLESELGKYSKLYVKGASYKSVSDSRFMSIHQYASGDSVMYYKHQETDDTIRYKTTYQDPDSLFEYELLEHTDTILGKVCNQLIVKNEEGNKSYYFSPELYINPEGFKNFVTSNMYESRKIMKAPFLRLSMSYEFFDVDIIATSITEQKIEEQIFKIPKDSILLKAE